MVGLYHIRARSVNLLRIPSYASVRVDVNILLISLLLFCFALKGLLYTLCYIFSYVARRCVSLGVPGWKLFFPQRLWATLREIDGKDVDYFGKLWKVMLFYQLPSAYRKLEIFSSTDYLHFNTDLYAEIIYKLIITDIIYTFIFFYTYILVVLLTRDKMQLLFTIIFFTLLFIFLGAYNVFIFGYLVLVYNYFYELQFFVAYTSSNRWKYCHRITHSNVILSSMTNAKTSTFYVCDIAPLFCCVFNCLND